LRDEVFRSLQADGDPGRFEKGAKLGLKPGKTGE
jgi:hypothetical protein